MANRSDLTAAFEGTDYCVFHQGQTHVMRLGQAPPEPLCAWLRAQCGHTPAWLITAHNPRGETFPDSRNRARAEVLDACLQRAGLHCLPSVNRDPRGHWPDEPGRLVAGLEEGLARSLARRFDQAAIVAVTVEQVELLWCSEL